MAYINARVVDDAHVRLKAHLTEAERRFWAEEAGRLQRELENIPAAVREWGHVEISDGRETISLIERPASTGDSDGE